MAGCCARVLLAVVLALATSRIGSSQDAQASPTPPLPTLQALTVDGLSIFSQADLSRRLSLEIGRPLPKDAEGIARDVETFYAEEGYTAARATARLDADGALMIVVREGRVSAIEFLGVDADRRAAFQREFELQPGDLFHLPAARAAITRLLAPSRGALETTPSTDSTEGVVLTAQDGLEVVERGGTSVLRVHLRRRTGRVQWSTGAAGREDWFSPVDGFAPALGVSATIFDQRRFNHTFFEAMASWKFGPDRPGYAIGLSQPFFASPRVFAGAELFDLTASDDGWRISSLEQSLVSLGFRNSYRDYYRRRGYQVHTALRLTDAMEIMAAWRAERHESLAVMTDVSAFKQDEPFRQNPAVDEGQHRAIVLGYAWDSRGFETETIARTYSRHQLDQPFGAAAGVESGWRIEWSSEISRPSFGSDYDYARHVLSARGWIPVGPRQRLGARLIGGWSGGELPAQRDFALGGFGGVRGYQFKEARGREMALLNVEYGVTLFRHGRLLALADAGRVFKPLEGSKDTWLNGVGVGWEFNDDLRIECGWRAGAIPRSLQVVVRLAPPF
jgi:outer membrane protein assembly factor BamA